MAELDTKVLNPLPPIRVFISSKCGDGGRYDAMRERLAGMLEETQLFQAYLWERGGASSLHARNAYISAINDSSICVVVIDNADGVPQGVQAEIDHIFRTQKRALFFFCSEASQEKTEVQKRLEGPEGPTYKTVDRMDDIPDWVIRSLQEEILGLYRKWCNYDVDWVSESPVSLPAASTVKFPREVASNLPGLREVFGKLIFGGMIEREPEAGLDAVATELAEALYIDMKADLYDPTGLLSAAKELLPREYSDSVEKRWMGICCYLKGQLSDSIGELEKALEIAQSRQLSSWFINDILVDLRNVSLETSAFYWSDGKYQKQLANTKEEIIFPLLDRAVYEAYEEIERDRVKEGLQNLTTFTIGDNSMRFFDPICKSFAIAACFGSLTHLSLTIHRLRYVVFYLCDKYHDTNLNASLLKLSIVCGKGGEAERTLQAFNDMSFDCDSASAKEIIEFCMRYKCMNISEVAPFEAFGALGIYLHESDFMLSSADFIQRVKESLSNMDSWKPKPAAVFKAMRGNANRLSLSWMLSVATQAIDSGRYFWREEALLFLADQQIDYSLVDSHELSLLLDALEGLASAIDDKHIQDLICNAIVAISCSSDEGVLKRIDRIVVALPDSDQKHYRIVCGSEINDEGMAILVEKGIRQILMDNARQGINGVYAFGANHHVLCVQRIKAMHNPSLDLGKRLYAACIGTVASETYDCRGKIEACEAICELLQLYGVDEIGQIKETKGLLADKLALMQCHESGKASKLLLNVWLEVMSLLVGDSGTNDFCGVLARCYRSDYYTQAAVGDAVVCLCQQNGKVEPPTVLRGFLFAYACYLVKSTHFQLNLRGLKLLVSFAAKGDYRVVAAQMLFDSYMGQSPRGKMIIVNAIPLIRDIDSELADELRAYVLRDNTSVVVDYLKKTESAASN